MLHEGLDVVSTVRANADEYSSSEEFHKHRLVEQLIELLVLVCLALNRVLHYEVDLASADNEIAHLASEFLE